MNQSFPDHYSYTQKDIDNIKNQSSKNRLTPITTEKDMKRLKVISQQINKLNLTHMYPLKDM